MMLISKIKEMMQVIRGSSAGKDALMLGGMQMLTQVVNMGVYAIISRHLGPEGFSFVAFMATYLSVAFGLNAAFDSFFLWKIANKPELEREHVTAFMVVKVTANIFTGFLAACVLPFYFHGADMWAAYVVLALALVSNSIGFFPLVLTSLRKVTPYVHAMFFTLISFAALRVTLALSGASYQWFAIVVPLEAMIMFAYLYKYEHAYFPHAHMARAELTRVWGYIYDSRFHIGVVALSLFASRIDQLVLKKMVSAHEYGLYASSVRLVDYPFVIGSVLLTIFTPRVAKSVPVEQRKRIIKYGFALFGGLGLLFTFIIFVGAPLFIHILSGSSFLGAVPYVRVYVLSLTCMWIYQFTSMIFAAHEKMKYSYMIIAVGICVSVVSLAYFVPRYGSLGGSISQVCLQVSLALLSLLVVRVMWKKMIV